MKKNTEHVQNIIGSLAFEMELGINDPSPRIKRQYAKVKELFIKLNLELDLLNDMKEGV